MASKKFTVNTPDEMLVGVRDFLVNDCGFSVVKEVTDDLDIATQTFVDGKLCVLKDPIDKYYISIRSANHYNIWGNSYTKEEDKKYYKDSREGIGILMHPEYDGTSAIWCAQKRSPLYCHNNYMVNIGANIGMTDRSQVICCNYFRDNSAYTCMLFSYIASDIDLSVSTIDRESVDSFEADTVELILFGNLSLYNLSNIDSSKVGGFMLTNLTTNNGGQSTTTIKTRDNKGKPIKVTTVDSTANLPQPSLGDYLFQILSDKCDAYVHIECGDYPSQNFKDMGILTDDITSGCCWASVCNGGKLTKAESSRIVLPLFSDNSITPNHTALSYTGLTDILEGGGNNDMYDCKTFGFPIIISVLANPVTLGEVSPIGFVVGAYFVSTYNSAPCTYHDIKTYGGIKYTQIFPTGTRHLVNYIGIAIENELSKELIGVPTGGEFGH